METRDRPQSPAESSHHSVVDEYEPQSNLPSSYNMAAPMNDAELVALLMASPLYQKLENIKSQIEKGAHKKDKADKSEGRVSSLKNNNNKKPLSTQGLIF